MSDFKELLDLAAKRLGGMAVAANDEFFAGKENLLEPGPPVFDPHRYTDRGKEMDGWETRRRREPGHDWCVVRLGVPGIVRGVVVDTSHFRGNYPDRCSVDGSVIDGDAADPAVEWMEILPESKLEGDAVNEFAVESAYRFTHVRLNIHPDGGVARLRVYGEPLPDLRGLVGRSGEADLAAALNGGLVLQASDTFFASPHNINAPGGGRDMSDGWETRRRRGPGHDWAVLRLAAEAELDRMEVDTTNFKGNYPESCSLDAASGEMPGTWVEVSSRVKLGPHARHVIAIEGSPRAAQVRFNIHPDGGVARLRLHGRVTDEGWRALGVRWLNASLPAACEAELLRCCGSRAWARQVAEARPFGDFEVLLATADEVWGRLASDDRREAFAAHPRIGDRSGSAWSAQEQSEAAGAADEVAEGNRAYEERFGHVFLINATGRTSAQILAALRERLGNDPETELRAAAEEQRQITRLRLEKVVRP